MEKLDLYLTKSQFMSYNWCPFRYKREKIDKVRQPTSPQMFEGTQRHTDHDKAIRAIDLNEVPEALEDKMTYIRSKLPDGPDNIWDNVSEFEARKLDLMKDSIHLYKPKIVEKKFKTVYIDNEEVKVTLAGKPDNIYLEDDDKYNIYEFKTGKWKKWMTTSIRKELTFYYLLLDGQLDKEIGWISWYYPRAAHFDIEQIKKRTITAVKKNIEKIIDSHINDDFPAKFNDIKCANCHLLVECQLRD